ncbi:MAG: hypothetical protein DMF75_20165 [Acidobacteria bacterium]|nr:MAG: hypothetical protein DMF75_20165 [Acidobacteriota bacterium]
MNVNQRRSKATVLLSGETARENIYSFNTCIFLVTIYKHFFVGGQNRQWERVVDLTCEQRLILRSTVSLAQTVADS